MRFEWDRNKAKNNEKKHGVSFEEAMTVFYDPLSATFDDPDHSIDQERFLTLGFSAKGRLLVISHADTKRAIRIISARPATAHERKRHEN